MTGRDAPLIAGVALTGAALAMDWDWAWWGSAALLLIAGLWTVSERR